MLHYKTCGNVFLQTFIVKLLQLLQPYCVVLLHILLLCYLSYAVLLALLCLLAVCWCVCCVCYLSLSLSFSCFMVSPRKKYSFRSVILKAVKISRNLLFTVPLLHWFVWSGTYCNSNLSFLIRKLWRKLEFLLPYLYFGTVYVCISFSKWSDLSKHSISLLLLLFFEA